VTPIGDPRLPAALGFFFRPLMASETGLTRLAPVESEDIE